MKPAVVLLFLTGLLSTQALGETARPKAPTLVFQKVDCSYAKCTDKDHHGNLIAKYGDGRSVTLISDGKCLDGLSKSQDPQISPNGQTIGLLTGEHFDDSSGTYYDRGSRLLLFRNGKQTATIAGNRYFIEAWSFWNNGKQIILRSRAKHGVGTVELHDAATGKLIKLYIEYKVKASDPVWARKMAL